MSSIVRFNVGGKKFSTTLATLECRGENMLSAMVKSDVGAIRDADGAYFIDRNGRMFEHVLDYLRTGKLRIAKEQVESELNYYAISGIGVMLEEISDKTLVEQIEDQQCEILHKYEKETKQVVEAVLQDLAETVRDGGFQRGPQWRGYKRVAKKGPPVFINKRAPKGVSEGSTTFFFKGIRVPNIEVWTHFMTLVRSWAMSADKRVFPNGLNGLQWPPNESHGSDQGPWNDVADVIYLNMEASDIARWSLLLVEHFQKEYNLTMKCVGHTGRATDFPDMMGRRNDLGDLSPYLAIFRFVWTPPPPPNRL